MPAWLAHEVTRATAAPPPRPAAPPPAQPDGSGPAAYLATVISRGATQLAAMTDGRKRTSHQAFMNGPSYRPNKAPARVIPTGNTSAS